jgi:hypothetical protein
LEPLLRLFDVKLSTGFSTGCRFGVQVTSTAGVSVRKHDGVERRVLVVSRHFCGELHKWVGPFSMQVLLTSRDVKSKLESMKHAYAAVEAFDNFDSSALVEWRAVQLHKQHNFTHVVALIEQELLRAARIRELLGIKVVLAFVSCFLRLSLLSCRAA